MIDVTAGYSGTPLPHKLGIKAGCQLAILQAPNGFSQTLGTLPEDVRVQADLGGIRPLDVVILFATERDDLVEKLPHVRKRMAPAGGFWVAWPKKAAKVATDLTEDVVREVALPTGLVDNKVCAIDAIWSGLRLVIRRELR
jgi:hypothetical protein